MDRVDFYAYARLLNNCASISLYCPSANIEHGENIGNTTLSKARLIAAIRAVKVIKEKGLQNVNLFTEENIVKFMTAETRQPLRWTTQRENQTEWQELWEESFDIGINWAVNRSTGITRKRIRGIAKRALQD